nr:exostosin-2-like [Ciona intestinalis]|eukprot:XP_002119284.3 exostosin-2-like [Ciona intestinalis]
MSVKLKPVHHKVILVLLLLSGVALIFKFNWNYQSKSREEFRMETLHINSAHDLPVTQISLDGIQPSDKADLNCKMYNCFDIYRCGSDENHPNKMKVFLHPLSQYTDESGASITPSLSKEFVEMYYAIAQSDYYTGDPDNACIFIPPVDMLNQNRLNVQKVGQLLTKLPHWTRGTNNLIFNFLPGNSPDYSTAIEVPHNKAIIAGGGFSHWTYRSTFDVSIPVYSPLVKGVKLQQETDGLIRKWLLISSQTNIHPEFRQELETLASSSSDFLLLDKCRNVPEDVPLQFTRCKNDEQKKYPEILQEGTFCLLLPTSRLGQSALMESMQAGCIPVFACDTYILPFSEVLDWSRASVLIREDSLPDIMNILRRIPHEQVVLMKKQVEFLYTSYFTNIPAITMTTLQIINDRVFPHVATTYEKWNNPPSSNSVQSPLFLPLISPKEDGFTAVILAYDRVLSLFQLIKSIDKVPSLRMILVVWNNQHKAFPARNEWPIIEHEWKVIQTSSNELSNRFFPYNEIKTEGVLAIDDDIIMLTTDEIEFGFQVWREFNDRIVGFPPRLHIWGDDGKMRYVSDWTNDISIVLTGAAFYHNYYNYLYTYKMPGGIKDWVDNHMNCEDIAMNFLVSNYSGKAPIKVTPRKKFKCAECATGGSLSLDETHMVERSTCMNHFASIYGVSSLKAINFRADPVLFMDKLPEKRKHYPDIGSL